MEKDLLQTYAHTWLKILSPKQMLQRMPIVLAQVKSGNTYGNLLNEIRHIVHSLYRAKEVSKKVYNNVMNSMKLYNKMDTIVMNSENSKTSDPQRLLLNLTDKTNLKRSDKHVALSNLSIYYTWKNKEKSYKNNKFKISDPTRNYLMYQILYKIFKIILSISQINMIKLLIFLL